MSIPKPNKSIALRKIQRENMGTQVDPALVTAITTGVLNTIRGLNTAGWFSPLQPPLPIAPDDAKGRVIDYPAGYNLRQIPRQEEEMSFWHLRRFAEGCDVLRTVIETRKDQFKAMDWKVKAREGFEDQVTDDEITRIETFWQHPSSEYDWDQWIGVLLDDMFVIDAVALYPRYTRGGDVYSIDIMDAATIKRVIEDSGLTPAPPSPAYQQRLHGILAANYSADELYYIIRNPRSYKLYGYGPVEQIITTVNIAIRRALSQLQYFTEGNVPEAIAGVPESWSLDMVKAFQMYWDDMMEGNTAQRRHMKFVPFDPSKIKEVRDPLLKDIFDEWLARIICYVFSVSPQPFIKEMNRATAQTNAQQAKQEGLTPVIKFLKRRLTYLSNRYLKSPFVEFHFDTDEDVDPLTQATIDQIYVGLKVLSPDEVREDRFGLDPMTDAQKETAWPGSTMDPAEQAGATASAQIKAGLPPPKPKPGGSVNVSGNVAQMEQAMDLVKAALDAQRPMKVVVAPTINVPERQVRVEVGDVNVTADIGSALEKEKAE